MEDGNTSVINPSQLATLKGPTQPHLYFLFTCESLALISYSEEVETKQITVKLLSICNRMGPRAIKD